MNQLLSQNIWSASFENSVQSDEVVATLLKSSRTFLWNVTIQLQQDSPEWEEQERVTHEAEEAQQAQQAAEDEEACKESDKKKPKLLLFNPECHIKKCVEARPALYAINKLNNLEYVELDYFTPKSCKEALADMNRLVNHDALTFMQQGDTFAMCPLVGMRPSKNIRSNEELSWEEVMDAKNVMLHFMVKSRVWQDEHAVSVATLYLNLNCHPRKGQKNRKAALILYQSHAHMEWFEALKHGECFNLALIKYNYLCSLAEVNSTIQDRENTAWDRDVNLVWAPLTKTKHMLMVLFVFSSSLPNPPPLLVFPFSSSFAVLHIMPTPDWISPVHSLLLLCCFFCSVIMHQQCPDHFVLLHWQCHYLLCAHALATILLFPPPPPPPPLFLLFFHYPVNSSAGWQAPPTTCGILQGNTGATLDPHPRPILQGHAITCVPHPKAMGPHQIARKGMCETTPACSSTIGPRFFSPAQAHVVGSVQAVSVTTSTPLQNVKTPGFVLCSSWAFASTQDFLVWHLFWTCCSCHLHCRYVVRGCSEWWSE